jgi:hypothetical protein
MLSCDQIQIPARQPYGVYAKLEDPMGVLSVALRQWEDRDDSKAQPDVRRAANTAMAAIDGMLRDLHAMRARLVSEIRGSDDATAARVDAMLAASARTARASLADTPAAGFLRTAGGQFDAQVDPEAWIYQ